MPRAVESGADPPVHRLRARRCLETVGVRAEVVDPVWLAPLDLETLAASARRTGRLLVVDNGWTSCGAGASLSGTSIRRACAIAFASASAAPKTPIASSRC